MASWTAIIVAILYFLIQSWTIYIADRQSEATINKSRPLLYSLAIAASGSSWLYYGSTGYAALHGAEFIGLYVGILLVFTIGFPFLLKLRQLARVEGITSISDMIGARYGKSFTVAAIVTSITAIALIPYFALQMTSIHYLLDVLAGAHEPQADHEHGGHLTIPFLFITLTAVCIIFYSGWSNPSAERYNGFVHSLALDTVLKYVAILCIGTATAAWLFGSPTDVFSIVWASRNQIPAIQQSFSVGNFISLVVFGASSAFLLPNQFHLIVVHNKNDGELRTARWFVPVTMLFLGIFIFLIAIVGSVVLPEDTSVDFYFLALPIAGGQPWLTIIALAGGLAAATTMMLFPSILLSVMISNDLLLPLFLKRTSAGTGISKDFSKTIFMLRRAAVCAILLTAFGYQFIISASTNFASLILISATAMVQLVPAFLGGMLWSRANARGVYLGTLGGMAVWFYTMILPSLVPIDSSFITDGPWGIIALRPQALFGFDASHFVNGLFWTLSVNIALFIAGSFSRTATPSERIQASIFIADKVLSKNVLKSLESNISVRQLKATLAKYIGSTQTELAFSNFHRQSNIMLGDDDPADFNTIHFSEQFLSGIVGPPSARLILSLAMGPASMAQRQAQTLLDHATDAFSQNRQLLQTALDQMDQGIGVFDSQYRLSCWNLQFQIILELPREQQRMGTSLDRILIALFRHGDIFTLKQPVTREAFINASEPLRLKLKKSGRTMEIRSNPMPDGGLVTTFTDISEIVNTDELLRQTNESLEQRVRDRTAELTLANQQLAKAQKRAEEANIEKTRFLADAGHDILQPLNAARLYSSALIERLGDMRESDLVQNIDSSLEAVESIISALLDISQLDTGALKPVISVFRLDALLQQIGRDFSPVAHEKGLELRIVATSAIVTTDRNLLRRLIQNLVSNAIKYSRSGRILVGVRKQGEFVQLKVCDTGIGIAPSKLDYIFREFARLAEGMKESDGLGLGLSIVERIGKILDLDIVVSSVVGKGSVFSVTIPLSNALALSSSPTIPVMQPAGSLSGMRILCVDDNTESLAGLEQLLSAWGCTVFPFQNGNDVREFCLQGQSAPDAILADYNLAEENGLDLIQLFRSHYDRDVHAALITAERSNDVQQQANTLGISLINKPVRPAILRALLSHFRQDIAAQ
ncbi:PAS-domain containing protein [Phyllobacterium sp. YR531]|uniref:hybrid sensor histidine kinase/response regulator n=1 Tax=Phyllobacterium sp. YR531 TaxID=1144343 RepID=UPI00026FA12D|nr:PAS-domain containing protein [Phyllobacterium sp. YR531]EJN05392.1 signal transduction histidine kinase [Phyllobacterium sp. YR531]